jgi:N-methylhydantoinase A
LIARARREVRGEGAAPQRVHITALLDVRYAGQSYELALPMAARYRTAFHRAHSQRYGYADADRSIEVVNLRVIATAALAGRRLTAGVAPGTERSVFTPQRVRWNGRWLTGRRCDRAALRPGRAVPGPLVITEISATTFVPPGWSVRCTASGDLLLETSGSSPASSSANGGG